MAADTESWPATVNAKLQLKESDRPKRMAKLKFGLFSGPDIIKTSHFRVVNRELYEPPLRTPVPNSCLDPRLGVSGRGEFCQTCGGSVKDCMGHFAHIKLELPVFHIGYFKAIIAVLQCICKYCSRILLQPHERVYFLQKMRHPNAEALQRKVLFKQIAVQCKKASVCPYCSEFNGMVKKVGPLKIIHERYGRKRQDGQEEWIASFEEAIEVNKDLRNYVGKAQESINPLRCLSLFEHISSEDCELLDMDPKIGRPELLITTHIQVPPVCIRPSVKTMMGQSNEDDITAKLAGIVHINNHLKLVLKQGAAMRDIMGEWDFLQTEAAMVINSEQPGLLPPSKSAKPTKGFCQRLKGKTGRFRGNLSGKRVDFSGRTVISPDPNLRIDQVGVPELVCKVLTYPERVNKHNMARLKAAVANGPDVHPGAQFVEKQDGSKKYLRYGKPAEVAKQLRCGDVVERHLIDGDVVLFNRQPSLHKLSIMCHRAKVVPWRTFRFNECVCNPYNADFDGDEMNLHVPQTEEARAEAIELMGVVNNLVTPRNGEPIVASIQDFITGSYLISQRDVFFSRADFCQICAYLGDAAEKIDLPPPCIIKPMELWTGKQIYSVLLRANNESSVLVNLETKCRNFAGDPSCPVMCPKDGYLVIRRSEVLCGTFDKSILGGGSKDSLFYVLLKDTSPAAAAKCMSRMAKFCARWLGTYGFSIGISDVTPSEHLSALKERLVNDGYAACDEFIKQYRRGDLALQPGCTLDESLEAVVTGELSGIRDEAGQMCINELHRTNAPLIMAVSGSKGSKINISQMVACVGQQTVSGSRIPDGFLQRPLPHFKRNSKVPPAKGFVRNSFFTGLTPTEFFFHTMGGREGLVDTAVKTADTGYMQRRLMKALEDLGTLYDGTVRNSVGGVVQFIYGDDALDPAFMEDKSNPINFPRAMENAKILNPCPDEADLSPYEIRGLAEARLAERHFTEECSEYFLKTITNYISKYASELADVRRKLGLPPLDDDEEEVQQMEDDRAELMASVLHKHNRLTATQLNVFLEKCLLKYLQSKIEPGTCVGGLGAQSIGEPGTQMTLKTFHFAGVASMNITLGVPRIKEIINASKNISTPIITAPLVTDNDVKSARIVKMRIEKTTLGEIADVIEEVYTSHDCFLSVILDMERVSLLRLDVDANVVRNAILNAPKLKLKPNHVHYIGPDRLRISPIENDRAKMFYSMHHIKNMLAKVIVKGIPSVERAVINKKKVKGEYKYNLLVEGYDLVGVAATPGVMGTHTTSNHIMEVEKTYGIEAARTTIMNEINYTMSEHGMSIDLRHVMLLADLMSFRGEILGITRFGIAKMKESVLMLASFEMTTDHLFDAAVHGRSDAIVGVSECIIMGMPIPLGTGLFKLLRRSEKVVLPPRRKLIFDSIDHKKKMV